MITRYAVFDETSGTLKRSGDCSENDFELQALFPGEVVRRLSDPIDPFNPPTLAEFDAAGA